MNFSWTSPILRNSKDGKKLWIRTAPIPDGSTIWDIYKNEAKKKILNDVGIRIGKAYKKESWEVKHWLPYKKGDDEQDSSYRLAVVERYNNIVDEINAII